MNEGKLNSILMLWDVPFEKRTQRMENLLSILAAWYRVRWSARSGISP